MRVMRSIPPSEMSVMFDKANGLDDSTLELTDPGEGAAQGQGSIGSNSKDSKTRQGDSKETPAGEEGEGAGLHANIENADARAL